MTGLYRLPHDHKAGRLLRPSRFPKRRDVDAGSRAGQRDYDNEKVWTQASGRVTLIADLDERILEPGASVRLATGQTYRLENRSPNAAHALLLVI